MAPTFSLSLPLERRLPREATLHRCFLIGVAALEAQKHPLDVVELVRSVLATAGTVEMKASIMEGKSKRCGAVSGLSTVILSYSKCTESGTVFITLSATSTGGIANKRVGRIGVTPVTGAGTYANNLCTVSATGKGEAIIPGTVARDVAALIEYKSLSVKEAATYAIHECVARGNARLVVVSAKGEVAMPFNSI
ncbi:hypothetical protein K2173_006670 [Erythroxylum novogranatense]|uniref:beta-aspartyl-peptidase n=1 Tax=Erythroxylum novogranatense TaxID=1862640 RepID=A0AAV8T7A0_9ROSI|nr:hypothetical protein K2173_006670 [Erythroxylum novogranatense]